MTLATRSAGPVEPRFDRLGPLDRLALHDQATALLTVLVAAWLFIGAWALGYAESGSGGNAYLNESVIGVLLLFLALSRVLRPLRQRFASIGVMLLGAWLIISPFIWGYGEPPYFVRDAPPVEWGAGAAAIVLGLVGLLWATLARRAGYPRHPR